MECPLGDNILDLKTSFSKFTKIEIILSIFFDHCGTKLEVNSKKKTEKFTNMWGLNGMLGEGNGNPLQYSCLADPVDRGAWWAAVYGVAQSWT